MCFAPQRRALFHIATSKSGPRPRVFNTFDLEMCFAPQRRALFWHLNFKKWSEPLVFLTFWLGNVLRATTACTFSSLIWPAGSAPAALASLLFDPPEPQIIGKTQWIATFLPFRASASSVFYSFSSTLLSSNLSLLSASSLLCFSSLHIVGSLTPELPSIIGTTHCLTERYLHRLVSLVLLHPTRPWSHVICDVLLPFGFPLSVLLLPSAWYNNPTSFLKPDHWT